ncbi:hypothetical protein LGQ02_14890 [Bacillus shivajii]|uniref:hypothetical protein n=1 Tax=Bacillus shivajii TaxID=1983719 RepID=UPI001CFAFCCE|nr:hypothetical protein [Bacillus shivajii]UCZ52124.1 hypothetical protein LGQ02_14890 [Bacillus shivajii]
MLPQQAAIQIVLLFFQFVILIFMVGYMNYYVKDRFLLSNGQGMKVTIFQVGGSTLIGFLIYYFEFMEKYDPAYTRIEGE